MVEKRRVHELMNPDVVCVRPDMTVAEAGRLLAKRGVSGAPVVDEDGHVVGVVSQNDLVRHGSQRVSAGGAGRFYTDVAEYRELGDVSIDRSDSPVASVMHRDVASVQRETGVAIAANVMRERKIHRLLVTDRGRLVGMITTLDLMRVVEENC